MQSLKALAVIPARIGSTRFPKKVLTPIQGKPMVVWVYEKALFSKAFEEVWVATDSLEVTNVIEKMGGKAFLTPSELASGTDRVAWLVKNQNWDGDIVVNIQGDEPLISSQSLFDLVKSFEKDKNQKMATLFIRAIGPAFQDPQVVKIFPGADGRAQDFSRQPFRFDSAHLFYKHIGIYAFTRQTLLQYNGLNPVPRELTERLEQLRAIEHKIPIGLVECFEDTIAVDVPGDVEKVERKMSEFMKGARTDEEK